jgi:hypothetical protein
MKLCMYVCMQIKFLFLLFHAAIIEFSVFSTVEKRFDRTLTPWSRNKNAFYFSPVYPVTIYIYNSL